MLKCQHAPLVWKESDSFNAAPLKLPVATVKEIAGVFPTFECYRSTEAQLIDLSQL
jgi:hypothetical protein